MGTGLPAFARQQTHHVGKPNMYLPSVEFHRTQSLAEASALLERYGSRCRVLAGGTDLLVDLKAKRLTTDHLISISRIESLKEIAAENDSLRIGALTTISQLGESELVRERFPALLDATRVMAVQQVRNLATVGGNIASAVPCADLPPILTALRGSVALWSNGSERLVPLDEFFVGARQTVIRDTEILSGVIIPFSNNRFGAAYARFGLREGNAIAVAAVAAGIQLSAAGTIEDTGIILSAVSPKPKIATEASNLLRGEQPSDSLFAKAAEKAVAAADPISDVRGSAAFRRELVSVLTQRALSKALQRAEEGAR